MKKNVDFSKKMPKCTTYGCWNSCYFSEMWRKCAESGAEHETKFLFGILMIKRIKNDTTIITLPYLFNFHRPFPKKGAQSTPLFLTTLYRMCVTNQMWIQSDYIVTNTFKCSFELHRLFISRFNASDGWNNFWQLHTRSSFATHVIVWKKK